MICHFLKSKRKLFIFLLFFVFISLFFFLKAEIAKAAFDCHGLACYGRPGENSGNFTIRATDPNGDPIYYIFYWVDGTETRCPAAGFVPSGTTCPSAQCACSSSHSWANPGIYAIYARAFDAQGGSPNSNIVTVYISNLANFDKSVDKTRARLNDILNYTISFNIESAPTHELEVRDPVPPFASYVNGSASFVCPSGSGGGSLSGGVVVWNLGDQATGACILRMQMVMQGGPVINTATASARNANAVSDSVTTILQGGNVWLQTEWGDAHSDGRITNYEPNGRQSATYIASAAASISGFSSEQGNLWKLENYHKLTPVFANVDVDGLIAGDYGERKNTNDGEWKGRSNPLSNQTWPLWRGNDPWRNVWYRAGNLTLGSDGPLYLERGGTIVVDGNVDIANNIFYDNNPNMCTTAPPSVDCRLKLPSFGLVVRGNVNIRDSITHIAGNFYVLGTVYTGDTDSDQLMVEGSMVAEDFALQRDYSDNDDAGEWIRYDGRTLVNPPPGFLDPAVLLPYWTRIKP